MSLKLNLLAGGSAPDENFEYVFEETNRNSPASLYIKGPYMMAEGVNKNKRLYPIDELRREVEKFQTEMIETGRAMGELNHPESVDINPERACHIVTELREEGNVFYGKSKVLSTPCGLIVRSLINDGVKMGMSSRALGTIEEKTGHNIVRNMKLVTIDCVADPSFPKAFVNGILESKQWVLADTGKLEEVYDSFEKSLKKLPKKEIDSFLREQILKFINSL